MARMDDICNKLEKLRAPNFVTVKAENPASKRAIMIRWTDLSEELPKLVQWNELYSSEIQLLSGFLGRKEVQLRREKAQLLTRRVYKLTCHWKANEFLSQLKQFNNAMGKFSRSTIKIIAVHVRAARFPSSQWCCWIIYLILRESSILAKIKLECENATKFWLGLIASSHHWGDSLVVTAILSRLWHLSSLLLEQFTNTTYPSLVFILDLLEPTNSSKWPNENWETPRDLQIWLKDNMNLPFQPANFTKAFPSKQTSNAQMTFVLSRIFNEKTPKVSAEQTISTSTKESLTTIKFGTNDDHEDYGIPVTEPEVKTKAKNKPRMQKDTTDSVSKLLTDWKSFKKYWRIFLKEYDTMLNSKAGRRSLLTRINKYRREIGNSDRKIKIKLKGLRRSLLGSTDGNLVALSTFQKFESFVQKRTKEMKNS